MSAILYSLPHLLRSVRREANIQWKKKREKERNKGKSPPPGWTEKSKEASDTKPEPCEGLNCQRNNTD